MSDKAENLHAALDWEVTLLPKNMSNAKLLTLQPASTRFNPLQPASTQSTNPSKIIRKSILTDDSGRKFHVEVEFEVHSA